VLVHIFLCVVLLLLLPAWVLVWVWVRRTHEADSLKRACAERELSIEFLQQQLKYAR
jgi:hypothetical protein